jgi:hypothetical protein
LVHLLERVLEYGEGLGTAKARGKATSPTSNEGNIIAGFTTAEIKARRKRRGNVETGKIG